MLPNIDFPLIIKGFQVECAQSCYRILSKFKYNKGKNKGKNFPVFTLELPCRMYQQMQTIELGSDRSFGQRTCYTTPPNVLFGTRRFNRLSTVTHSTFIISTLHHDCKHDISDGMCNKIVGKGGSQISSEKCVVRGGKVSATERHGTRNQPLSLVGVHPRQRVKVRQVTIFYNGMDLGGGQCMRWDVCVLPQLVGLRRRKRQRHA